MNTQLLTAQNLKLALENGDLFLFDNDKAALRAWAVQSHSSDYAVKALMSQKPWQNPLPSFSHWVDVLTKVNLSLQHPITPKKSKEAATLLDYFMLEEELISKYIQQIGANKHDTELYDMASAEEKRLQYTSVSGDLLEFFRIMPQYVDPETDLALLFKQNIGPHFWDWAEQLSIERTKPYPTFFFFMIPAVILSGLMAWTWSTLNQPLAAIMERPDFWIMNVVVITLVKFIGDSLVCSQQERMEQNHPHIYDHMDKCVTTHFKPLFSDWHALFNPHTFESRFLLRAYFNMMHYTNLNAPTAVAAFNTTPRMLIPAHKMSLLFVMTIKFFRGTQQKLTAPSGVNWLIKNGTKTPPAIRTPAAPYLDSWIQ